MAATALQDLFLAHFGEFLFEHWHVGFIIAMVHLQRQQFIHEVVELFAANIFACRDLQLVERRLYNGLYLPHLFPARAHALSTYKPRFYRHGRFYRFCAVYTSTSSGNS